MSFLHDGDDCAHLLSVAYNILIHVDLSWQRFERSPFGSFYLELKEKAAALQVSGAFCDEKKIRIIPYH